jgi:hypothetical protein
MVLRYCEKQGEKRADKSYRIKSYPKIFDISVAHLCAPVPSLVEGLGSRLKRGKRE